MARAKTKPVKANDDDVAAVSEAASQAETVELSAVEKKELKKREKEEKKEKKKQAKAEKKRNRPLILKILPYLFLLAILGFAVAVIGYNFMGLREKYLRTTIDQIPIVNNILTPPLEEDPEDPTSTMTRDDLAGRVKQLETELAQKDTQIETLNKRIEENNNQIAELTVLTSQQEQFRQDKAEFDEEIAKGNPANYAKYYESIQPDSAADLYKEVVGTVQLSKDAKKYMEMVSSIDEASSAKILEVLVPTDMDLVVQILKNIDSSQSSAIIGAMQTENAAAVVKQMAPPQG